MNIYNDNVIKESIHWSAFIDEYSEEEKRENPIFHKHPHFTNYNFIWVNIPVKVKEPKELLVFKKKMKASKFIFKEEPIFRVNYNSNTEYSKICPHSVLMLIDFSRGAKQIKETINDNQLKLFI